MDRKESSADIGMIREYFRRFHFLRRLFGSVGIRQCLERIRQKVKQTTSLKRSDSKTKYSDSLITSGEENARAARLIEIFPIFKI